MLDIIAGLTVLEFVVCLIVFMTAAIFLIIFVGRLFPDVFCSDDEADNAHQKFKRTSDYDYNAYQKFKRTCDYLSRTADDWATCLHEENPTATQHSYISTVCSPEHCPLKVFKK
jgi:hypothetical protein